VTGTTSVLEVSDVAQSVKPAARVAHLTSVHTAFDVRIFQKECRSLASAGYDVVLIAPHGRDETVEGVKIESVTRREDRSRRMTATVRQVYLRAIRSGATLFHFHDPELIPVGVLLKLRGKRVIYDVHENVAQDVLTKDWIHPRVRRFVSTVARIVESASARIFDGVVAATPAIAGTLPKDNCLLLQNFPIVGELVNETALPYRDRDPMVVYAGSITEMKGARQMVSAMHLLPENLSARLLLLGDVESASLRSQLTASLGWSKVDHLGFQPRGTLAQMLGRARVGLVLFQPLPNYDDSQPNKLFEYMSAALPIVASNFPVWRDLIEKVGCGLVVNPLDASEIAKAIAWILEHPSEAEAMGRRGQMAVASIYNWESQAQSLLRLYDRLLR